MTTKPNHGVDALTEKEKQTLRLIVRGHDAKSIARSLDRSIHTINERLRDARRKLSVSSSREAARLLFEVEGDPPNPLRDTQIGEGVTAPELQRHNGTGRIGRLGWIAIGGAIMTLLLGLIALAAMPQMNADVAGGETAAIETSDPAIIDTARHFLSLADQGNWSATYRMTASKFQQRNTLAAWTKAAQGVQNSLGEQRSRVLMSEQSIPAPPHGYEVVKFRSSFAKKANVVETVSLVRENGAWKIAGITVG